MGDTNRPSGDVEARLKVRRADWEASLAKLDAVREWTFRSGAKRQAKYVGMRDTNTVLLEFTESYDGNAMQVYEVPFQDLSEFDQKLVRKAVGN